jgi:type IV secretory pathway VirB2 component (pilin)
MDWKAIGQTLSSESTLLGIGVALSIIVMVAWYFSNRAEATPNEEQLAEIRHFVNEHFARYVARGLAAEGVATVAVSKDPAWRKVYVQHLKLHNELYAFRTDIALQVFDQDIDAAVRRQLAAARVGGMKADPLVVAS